MYEDIPEDIRRTFPPGLTDLGGGKSVMEVDDEMVEACRGSRDYCAEMLDKSRAMVENIKFNGATFEETWAGFLALTSNIHGLNPEHSRVLLAYALTEQVFRAG